MAVVTAVVVVEELVGVNIVVSSVVIAVCIVTIVLLGVVLILSNVAALLIFLAKFVVVEAVKSCVTMIKLIENIIYHITISDISSCINNIQCLVNLPVTF